MERENLLKELKGSADYIGIYTIESITEDQAKVLALDQTIVKGHNIYFVDFGGYFGYSVLVFRKNHHIYHANDYELHHRPSEYTPESRRLDTPEKLKKYYIKTLRNKLFTYFEVMGDAKDYDELERKRYFTHNLFRQAYDTISPFSDEVVNRPKDMPFCPACFCYTYDEELRKLASQMSKHLNDEEIRINNSPEAFRKKIRYELANHEAGYTGDYEETLFSIGMPYDSLKDFQKQILHEELKKLIHESL